MYIYDFYSIISGSMSEMKEIEESILTDSTEVASPLEQRTEVTSSI